jgi:hypothetical protein
MNEATDGLTRSGHPALIYRLWPSAPESSAAP